MAETMLRRGDPRWAEAAAGERARRREQLAAASVADLLRRGERLSRQAVRLRAAAIAAGDASRRA